MANMGFEGFSFECFHFLAELEDNNNDAWFNKNRGRYVEFVRQSMLALAERLLPAVLEIDPDIDTDMANIVPMQRLDKRFSSKRHPYSESAIISFHKKGCNAYDGFSLYFCIDPMTYAYGMGTYTRLPVFLKQYRENICSNGSAFLDTADAVADKGFVFNSHTTRRNVQRDASEYMRKYLNVDSFTWERVSYALKSASMPSLADEVEQGYRVLAPLYRIITGMT